MTNKPIIENDILLDIVSDDDLERAAGYMGPGRTTWDSTSCSYCSTQVC